ncbi:uncharacterized protein TNCT_523671 [Trichonephila clavata]|uniref:Uncharacterized protein n=1 Tax=Trichonephila clavata TaxID=2740835 RepID=A0A8X6LI42_TRICU|nr:uncharacterized protein TNCT_523671 [Trichonephila clavata]
MYYLRCFSLVMWCFGQMLTAAGGQYFSNKNGYPFQNDLFNEWTLKNETHQRNPFHNIYVIKGPQGESQRVHYAIDDYGVRANIFTKHAQPESDTSSFGIGSQEPPTKLISDFRKMTPLQTQVQTPTDVISFVREKNHFPEITNFSSSKLSATHPDINITLNKDSKMSGIDQLTRKFSSSFSTKKALKQPIILNSSLGMKSINDSSFSVTHPPHQYFVRANLPNANINLQNSSSRYLPITDSKVDANDEKENVTEFKTGIDIPIKEYSGNVGSIEESDSVAPPMITDTVSNDSSVIVLTNSLSSVEEWESTPSSTMEMTSENSTRPHLEKDFNSTKNATNYNPVTFEPAYIGNQSLLTIQLNNSFANSKLGEENSNNVSMEVTTLSPPILSKNIAYSEYSSHNSVIQDEVYLSLLNSTVNGTNMNEPVKYNMKNWTESDQFSEILLPMLEEDNQSMKRNKTIAKLNNILTTDEIKSPENVTNITNFHPTETIEAKSNSSSQVNHNNSSPSVENISNLNRQPSEFQMEIVEEVSPSNETSFWEVINRNTNETSKDNVILTSNHAKNMKLGNHNKQSLQERVDKGIISVNDINNPLFTNQSTLTESIPELDNIFDRKSSEISQTNKIEFNKMKTSEYSAPPIFDSIDNRNIGYITDLANKVRLYPKELNNTLKVKNAFLKLWRGKSGVKIEPFGVNKAYKMIPVLQ